jgi:hypothetical protein
VSGGVGRGIWTLQEIVFRVFESAVLWKVQSEVPGGKEAS